MPMGKEGKIWAAFGSIDITPPLGEAGTSRLEDPGIREIAGRLRARVALFSDGRTTFCWWNSDGRQDRFLSNAVRIPAARRLGIPVEHTLFTSTHNHCNVRNFERFDHQFPVDAIPLEDREEDPPRPFSLYERETIENLISLAVETSSRVQPARLMRALGFNDRLTYNRKGRNQRGISFLMREADRLRKPDWKGTIDPWQPLIRVENCQGRVLGWLTGATGHPVVAFDPTRPRVHPDVTGVALEYLEGQYQEEKPVGLLFQGCAGDVNFKHMFGGVCKAEEMGVELGRSLAEANQRTVPFESTRLDYRQDVARIPLGELPSLEELEGQRREIEAFCLRARQGDPSTRRLFGYNFSDDIPPWYRENLVRPLRRWVDWAIEQRLRQAAYPARELLLPLQAFRLGDLLLIGCGAELFVEIGLEIRRQSPFPLTLVTGYANRVYGYIGRASDLADGEYMSAFYFHTRFWPPFVPPGGDRVIEKGIELAGQLTG